MHNFPLQDTLENPALEQGKETKTYIFMQNPCNSLLTVPRWLVCCGSLLSASGFRVSVIFHLMCVQFILVLVGLLSDYLYGKSCSLD